MRKLTIFLVVMTIFLTSSFVLQNEAAGDKASGKPAWETLSTKVCGDRLCSEIEEEYSESKIPDWIRNNAKWWSEGSIGDSDFISGIQFLIQNKAFGVENVENPLPAEGGEDPEYAESTREIPRWIKHNAGWWSQGLISDEDFLSGIQYLVENGIISVQVIIEPTQPSGIILRGKIVTMNSEDDWFEGYLLIQNEKIQKIWEGTPSEINLSDYNLIETDGIIFPGLINLHNHMYYSTLPLWNVEKPYSDRYQWNHGDFYNTEVSWPKNILTDSKLDDLRVEVVKYAEVKALIGGTTSIVGAAADKKYGEILVRNVEYKNFEKKKISTSVTKISSVDGNNIKSRFNAGTLDTWLVHLAEGIDNSSKKEFDTLDSKGLLREETEL